MEDRSIRKRRLTDEAGLPGQVVSPGATATNSAGGGRVVSPSPKKRQFTGSENSSPRHITNHTSKEDAEPMTAAEVSKLLCCCGILTNSFVVLVATRFFLCIFSRHFFFGICERFPFLTQYETWHIAHSPNHARPWSGFFLRLGYLMMVPSMHVEIWAGPREEMDGLSSCVCLWQHSSYSGSMIGGKGNNRVRRQEAKRRKEMDEDWFLCLCISCSHTFFSFASFCLESGCVVVAFGGNSPIYNTTQRQRRG